MGRLELRQLARATGIGGLVFILTFAYQNCSKGFAGTASSLSTQCLGKVQIAELSLLRDTHQLNCEQADRYSCETRVFSPTVTTSESQSQVCASLNGSQFCVPLITRSFNTDSARNLADRHPTAFAQGGEFNHQEVNCSYGSEALAVLRQEAPTAQMALEKLVASCQSALTNGAPQ